MFKIDNIIKKELLCKKDKKVIVNQLFFLTHNFYFFTKLKQLLKLSQIYDFNIYQIDKTAGTSYIENGNEFLKKYTTEYIFIVDEITKYVEKLNQNDYNYNIGINLCNSIRRVIEIFMSFKFPKNDKISDVDKILEVVPCATKLPFLIDYYFFLKNFMIL
jgi:wobble nucleotide-excising tRNase